MEPSRDFCFTVNLVYLEIRTQERRSFYGKIKGTNHITAAVIRYVPLSDFTEIEIPA